MTDAERLDREQKEIDVLKQWNESSAVGKYKPHRSLLPDAQMAIREQIKKGYTYEQIKSAIRNFAYVLSSPIFYFKYTGWTLAQFLSRGKKDDKGERWLWFVEDYFNPEKFWTSSYRNKAITQRELELDREKRRNMQGIKPIQDLTKDMLKKDETPKRDYQSMKLALIRDENG